MKESDIMTVSDWVHSLTPKQTARLEVINRLLTKKCIEKRLKGSAVDFIALVDEERTEYIKLHGGESDRFDELVEGMAKTMRGE